MSLFNFISEHKVKSGSVLYSSPLGNLLVGCPPEILKSLLGQGLPMPDTIVIPDTLHKYHSNQASLEFPFYHFLFIQQGMLKGKKLKVLAKESLCKNLTDFLRVTLIGPTLEESAEVEKKLGIPPQLDQEKIEQIYKEVEFLALKGGDDQHVLQIEELIEFIPFEVGDSYHLYPCDKHPELILNHVEQNQYQISFGETIFNPNLDIEEDQTPNYSVKATKISQEELKSDKIFTLRALGSSDGFDATQAANGFVIHFNGKWIIWDAPAYLFCHLQQLGLSADMIDGIFISHVHEDHVDPIETIYPDKKLSIYTSPEIYHCFLIKVKTLFECSYEEAHSYYNFVPVYANNPFDLFGAQAEVFYSVHAIPALGLRLSVEKKNGESSKILISGDTLSKQASKRLEDAGIYRPERLEEIQNCLTPQTKYDLAIMDAGGGIIHGNASDYYDIEEQGVIYNHTGGPIRDIPKHQKLLKAGQRFLIHR